jgi:hypothetical protein
VEAIAWVLGIGIFTGLLLAYPRRMGILVAILVTLAVVIVGAISGCEAFERHQRTQKISKIEVLIQHDIARCPAEYPLFVGLVNHTADTILKTTFSVSGFREGYSEPLYETGYTGYYTDRIMLPGERSGVCYRIPNRAHGMSEDLIERYPPATLVWTVTDLRPEFESP